MKLLFKYAVCAMALSLIAVPMRATSMAESIKDFERLAQRRASAGQDDREFVDRLNEALFKAGQACAAAQAGVTGAALVVWFVMKDLQQP